MPAKQRGYESSDDARGCTHHEGAAEDSKEDAHWREEGRGVKHVRVWPSWLVGHNGSETQNQHSLKKKNTNEKKS